MNSMVSVQIMKECVSKYHSMTCVHFLAFIRHIYANPLYHGAILTVATHVGVRKTDQVMERSAIILHIPRKKV